MQKQEKNIVITHLQFPNKNIITQQMLLIHIKSSLSNLIYGSLLITLKEV